MKHLHSKKTLKSKIESSNFNKKIELGLQKSLVSNKQKKKSLRLYEHDMEYYDNFLENLNKDKNNLPMRQSLKITRRKKSKTLKITKEEENRISTSINGNNKKIKNLMKKSLLKKQNNFLFNVKTQKSDSSLLTKIEQKNSLQMINNIQFSIEETNQKKKSFSSFKKRESNFTNEKNNNKFEEKEVKSFELSNDNITLIEHPPEVFLTYINKNPIEKIFEKNKNLIKTKTYSYSNINEKKRKKFIKNNSNAEKIFPIQGDFISNATKIDFSKKNSIQLSLKDDKNNNLNKNENDKNYNINETQKNSQITNIYKFDNSDKKKKFLFCCCLPIKV